MKKVLKIVVIILVGGFFLAQVFRPDRTNPPIVEADTLEASMNVPDNVKAILARSCNDCHSNNTTYPWYSNISPVSWFLVDHVNHGRSHLNFSIWNTYEKRRKVKRLEEIREQVELGAMPLPSYLWLHRGAELSKEDARILTEWVETARKVVEEPGG